MRNMRYLPGHKEKTHQKIVETGAKIFLKRGFDASGVDTVMKAAGLTSGGFLSHFRSKEQLISEALTYALTNPRKAYTEGIDDLKGKPWLGRFLRRVFTPAHRDKVEESCPLTSLVGDFGRGSRPMKEAYEAEFLKSLSILLDHLPEGLGMTSRQRGLATLALIFGGINLSRAVNDPELSDEILKACIELATPKSQEEKVDVER